MTCHNGATDANDYSGPGMNNPHYTVGGAAFITCTGCHGGNGLENSRELAHVARPYEISDDLQLANDAEAYFNFLTQTGIDKYDPYEANGQTYTPIDYLQFINPSDLRVVQDARGCGANGCHGGKHAAWVPRSVISTEAGFYSATMFTSGLPNVNADLQGLYGDTASEFGFRAITNPDYTFNPNYIGAVGNLYEFPERAQYGQGQIFENPVYDANQLNNQVYAASQGDQYANSIIPGTPLNDLVQEIVAITCGDCHGGSRGANNRFADFRSSGCASCHMKYSMDGRSRSRDPNVQTDEPANPDAIAPPEDAHPAAHILSNVAKNLGGGAVQPGIQDEACVGCHQGSNRTVLQFWGIRLDQNQDVVNNFQYPANPATFQNTADNQALYDPGVQNVTFNGRIADQYLEFEDYDNDQKDDTPEDVHKEAGMGCIDCHGSRDLHNGTDGDESSGRIQSRETQAVFIECESCHGDGDARPPTGPCVTYDGANGTCALDRNGNPLRNVTVDGENNFFLRSRVSGNTHFVPLTYDVIRNNNKRNPLNNQLLYSPAASYAMGRADGNLQTGIGPLQQNLVPNGFSHLDKNQGGAVECSACHASWANNCIGCHLAPGYNANPQDYFFSNTTGERIVLFQAAADFVYITPLPFQIGIGSRDLVASTAPGMKMFFRYDQDLNNNTSDVFAFTDRRGNGNNPNYQNRGAFGALAHNKIAPHSQRGAVDGNNEGVRSCANCHLNEDMINDFGAEYQVFYDAMANADFAQLDFNLLQEHIGQNTGNQLNSPFWVHMVVGLGTGLFLFDANGCPVNPLDDNPDRFYCEGTPPSQLFDLNNVAYNLDRMVENTGADNASSAHPLATGGASAKRIGSLTPDLAGPLGGPMLQKLADPNNGLILDSWFDADGNPQGNAADFAQ
jgi:predicted metal-binding protein